MINFSTRLKEALKYRNMTQAELAEKSNTTAATISRYLNDNRTPNINLLNSMASALNVTADYLLGNTNDPTLPSKKDDKKINHSVLLLQRAAEEGMPENEIEDILSYAKFRFPERFKGLVEANTNRESNKSTL